MGMNTRFPLTSSVCFSHYPCNASGSSSLTSMSSSFMNTLNQNRFFTNLKLWFHNLHSMCWASLFSSSHSKNHDPCFFQNCYSSHHLQWANALPSSAISCCTCQLPCSVWTSLERSSPVEYLRLNSVSWTALKKLLCIALSVSWESTHREQTSAGWPVFHSLL